MKREAIAEITLHAYVDGWLTSDQRAQVEVRLLQCTAEATRVRDYLAQRTTIRAYAGGGQDDVLPHYLIQSALGVPRHQQVWVCGCVVVFVLGVALGWWAQQVVARVIDVAPAVGTLAQASSPEPRPGQRWANGHPDRINPIPDNKDIHVSTGFDVKC